jgi:hypothetical protein
MGKESLAREVLRAEAQLGGVSEVPYIPLASSRVVGQVVGWRVGSVGGEV